MGPLNNMHIFMYMHFSEKIGLRILSYSPEGLGPNVVKLPGGWQGQVEILGSRPWSGLALPWAVGPRPCHPPASSSIQLPRL